MKNKRKRKVYLYLLIILGITVGFALLSTTLFINGTASIKSNTWNIHWDDTSINVDSGSVSANDPVVSTATTSKDTVSFDVELEMPGDYFEFEIDAVNEGTVDGELDLAENWITYSVGNDTSLPSYLDFSVTYDDDSIPQSGDILEKRVDQNTPGRQSYKIRVEFKQSETTLPSNPPQVNITVELPYVQHKDRGIKYDLGDLVYFDPVSESPCNSTTFNLNDVVSGTSTCYKWRVITTNDTETKTKITIQLDHNMAKGSIYTGTCGTGTGPFVVLSSLASETQNWTRIPLLNYEYDLGIVPDSNPQQTQKLVCEDGVCKVDRDVYSIQYPITGIRVRMITGEEFMDIAKTVNPAAVWDYDSSKRSEDVFTFSTNGSTGQVQSQQLKWLIENTLENSNSGATNNAYGPSTSYFYWMLTPDYDVSLKGWWAHYITFYGWMDSTGACTSSSSPSYSSYGARPVTEINKNMITKD